jgi:putative serine protease PepD
VKTALTIAAVIGAAFVIGAAAGLGAYALTSHSSGGTPVVERSVTVTQQLETASSSTTLTAASIYKLANKGVVTITVTFPPQSSTQEAQGSGFVYDANGRVITNQHVIDGGSAVSVTFWNGRKYSATVVGSDPSTDIAVLKVAAPASVLHPLQLGDSSAVQVGDPVVAIGSPFGLDETITSGIVSALHRQMTSPNNFTIADSIQTDAAINHGNSGGPLLNMQGKVIGVTSQIESDSGGNDGVGFAVPSNTVRKISNTLIATGKVEHAYLGVRLGTGTGGAHLTEIVPGRPAAQAGLRPGDVITMFGGKKIDSPDALQQAVDARQPGDTVKVTFRRNGTSHTVTVTLASRPS